MALVAGAAGERGADQAAARHGHAHGAVHERLQLQLARGAGAQSRDVLHAHLSRAHHAARAQLVPYARRLGVAYRGLGAHVQLDVRRVPLCQAQRAQVAHDERVDAGRGQRFEVRGKRLEVVGVHEGVQRRVRLRARIVRASCRSGNVVQREVRRALPQPETIGGQVHGVRTEAQRGLQLRKPARGREELGSPCRLSSHAPYCSASTNPRAGDHRNPSLRAGQSPLPGNPPHLRALRHIPGSFAPYRIPILDTSAQGNPDGERLHVPQALCAAESGFWQCEPASHC